MKSLLFQKLTLAGVSTFLLEAKSSAMGVLLLHLSNQNQSTVTCISIKVMNTEINKGFLSYSDHFPFPTATFASIICINFSNGISAFSLCFPPFPFVCRLCRSVRFARNEPTSQHAAIFNSRPVSFALLIDDPRALSSRTANCLLIHPSVWTFSESVRMLDIGLHGPIEHDLCEFWQSVAIQNTTNNSQESIVTSSKPLFLNLYVVYLIWTVLALTLLDPFKTL